MSQDGLTALEAELGAKPPGGLAQLTAEQQRALAQAIRDGRHRQAAELTAAGDQALFEHGMWPELLPLIPELPADAQERVGSGGGEARTIATDA